MNSAHLASQSQTKKNSLMGVEVVVKWLSVQRNYKYVSELYCTANVAFHTWMQVITRWSFGKPSVVFVDFTDFTNWLDYRSSGKVIFQQMIISKYIFSGFRGLL